MISICLKSKKTSTLNIIENYLDEITIPDVYYSQKKFKFYNNIIIHYKGTNQKKFFLVLSDALSKYIIQNQENQIIQNQLKFDYFYFTDQEKRQIQQSVKKQLDTESNTQKKYVALQNSVVEYFTENKYCIVEGFIDFRLYNYKILINSILENVINDYILQKEYSEYVHLLQEYIELQLPQTPSIHLIYSKDKKILLDESKNLIANTSNPKVYLSDISFSSNDFILNTLLSLLPEKLYIHVDAEEDNFIIFLKLIFKNKFYICNHCQICSPYLTGIKNGF